MKILDKIVEYFFERKIRVKNTICIDEINENYWNAVIYSKLPCIQKYCVWSTYNKTYKDACKAADKAIGNKIIVKDETSLVSYIDKLWWYLKNGWLNVIDIISDDGNVIKKAKGVFKKPVKKWYWGFGLKNCEFKPYRFGRINPILYINHWSMSWKPKYDYVCFEDNEQVWFCLFNFFWFGYILVSPVDEVFEYSYWEQMIWYVNYCGCDLKKAEETWYEEWNKNYLIGDE